MNEQQLQQAFIQYLAQKTGAKSQQELESIIQQMGEEGLKQAYAEFMQQMQQQQVRAAKFGAKLNYIKQLRGQCPDGYEVKYFKRGGTVSKECVACKQKQEVKEPSDAIEAFKCGRKTKKKACGGDIKKARWGTDLSTAPSAKERYNGGTQGRIENSNAFLNYSLPYYGFPNLTDYDVVVGNDGNMLYNPSIIGKGYDYQVGDSVAIEVPRHMPRVVVHTANPVYQSKNPAEFRRLSRRADEAGSVSKKKSK